MQFSSFCMETFHYFTTCFVILFFYVYTTTTTGLVSSFLDSLICILLFTWFGATGVISYVEEMITNFDLLFVVSRTN